MSLELKLSTWFPQRVKSLLGRSLLSASLLVGGCSTTEIGRRYIKTTWNESSKPPQEEVVRTRQEEGEPKIRQKLEDAVVSYNSSTITISVSEVQTNYVREVTQGRKAYLLEEVIEEEVKYEGPTNDIDCRLGFFYVPTFGLGTAVVGAEANDDDESEEYRKGAATTAVGIGLLTILFSSMMLKACKQKTWIDTETKLTGRKKPGKVEDYTKHSDFTAKAGESFSASDGSISSSGLFLGTAPIQNGQAVLTVPSLGNSLVFADNKNDAANLVDLSWIKPACQEGVTNFISYHAFARTMQLTVQTHPPSETRGYETDLRTYRVMVHRIPSRSNIINEVVNRHINSRIQQARVFYKDLESHFPVDNIQVSFTPMNVKTPADLAVSCFGEKNDRQEAIGYIKQYVYAPFDTRINGEFSFPVYVPSTFRVKAVQPAYRYSDEKLQFMPGLMEQERFLVELGAKHRVKKVPE